MLGEMGTVVPQASHRRKFLILEGVHMLIEDDGAGSGRVPMGVVEEVAGMAAESDCVDQVTEMFVDRVATDLLHSDLGQWAEECVNLKTINYQPLLSFMIFVDGGLP